MKILENTPLWVTLAFGNVETRKTAILLIISSIIFSLYCVPWVQFSKLPLVARLFLIHDWSWFAVMVPMVIWYWLSLRWIDQHQAWGS